MAKEGKIELTALGDVIRNARKKLGYSQEDFAEICGVHRTYAGQVERGEKNLSFSNLLRFAKASRLKPSELLSQAKL